MRINAGIITDKIEENKKFYCDQLDFTIVWEADWFLLLSTPNGQDTISFLKPDHPSQHKIFHQKFSGQGIYLTFEVDKVDEWYNRLMQKKVTIVFPIKDEPWGDRHFAIVDPNGVSIDFVTHTSQ